MKKITICLSFFFLVICFKTSAQQNYRFDNPCVGINNVGNNNSTPLMPVYYNYSRRQLFYNGTTPMRGNTFLAMCRSMDDIHMQRQIERHDQLTKNKKRLVTLTIVSGVAGYLLLVTSASQYRGGYNTNPSVQTGVAVGAISLLACPILAISTSIPHQKRKEVVFRDLPAAYNFYVESHTKNK